MNESYLLSLLERAAELYERGDIVTNESCYTPEFKSLMGDVRDVLSNVE